MGRQKTKVATYSVALNQAQDEALHKLMKEDMQDNVSSYFGLLIAEVVKNRDSQRRGAVGRPKKKKDESGKDVKWYPCPYDENAPPYTMDDLKAYYEFRGMAVPPQPPAYSKEQLKKWDM